MIKIAICYQNSEPIISGIQSYLINSHFLAKITCYKDIEKLNQKYDIYFLGVGLQIQNQKEEDLVIYIGKDSEDAVKAYQSNGFSFLMEPIQEKNVFSVLEKCRKQIKRSTMIITTSQGERKVNCYDLNYVNIEKRCLCYHLKDGTMFDGQTLRTSFEKAIAAVLDRPIFLFVAPSLLINLAQIHILNRESITFENGEKLYFPKSAYKTIKERWTNYNIIR